MHKALRKFLLLLYHLWFYILVAVPIIIFFPFLLLFTLSERTYPQFFWMARNLWASFILFGMGCPPRVHYHQRLERGKSYMLVANHTSMLDIMLMLRVSRNPFVFVGKKELVQIPLFGFFYKRVCIMVDRDDSRSRMGVYRRAEKRIRQGLSICIFPEGGVPPEEVLLDSFKDGAFKMAIAHKLPVVPAVFLDAKKRLPFSLTHGGPGPLRVIVHPFVSVEEPGASISAVRQEVRLFMMQTLEGQKQSKISTPG